MSRDRIYCEVSELLGKTLETISGGIGDEEMQFITDTGEHYRMYHDQDCCESVTVDDIIGNLDDLVGSPLTMAEEETNSNEGDAPKNTYSDSSFTWTFYKFATLKGYVTIKWYGTSNGYYSESVTFAKLTTAQTSDSSPAPT